MKTIQIAACTILLGLFGACAAAPKSIPAQWEKNAQAPSWALAGNGARTAGVLGEGFYAVGIGKAGKAGDATYTQVADRQAMDGLGLVLDRFWLRSLGLISQKTGVYGIFRSYQAAPCRVSLASKKWGIVRRWKHPSGKNIHSLAFIPQREIRSLMTNCKGCKQHPVCKLMGEHLNTVMTDYAAWSEIQWQHASKSTSWVERDSGPFLDGPAGRGFYGVGRLDKPADPLVGMLELQHRSQIALRDSLLLFVAHSVGLDIKSKSNSIVPPCITAVEHLRGNVIEVRRRKEDGYATAALAFVPANMVRALIRDCNGCSKLNICRSMYSYFDDLFKATAKSYMHKKFKKNKN